jgi:chitinase
MASDNVAVYYGQVPSTLNASLTRICADPAVDIVILAFVTGFLGAGGWPSLYMGGNCGAPTTAQVEAGATDLKDCVITGFADEVAQCQENGKKVMLSVGGANADTSMLLPSNEAAEMVAETLWELFLGGQSNQTTSAIRPFGNVILDGIDIGISEFTSRLRTY